MTKHKLHEQTLRKKCPYSDFFWSVFSRIRTEYELKTTKYELKDINYKYDHNEDQFHGIIAHNVTLAGCSSNCYYGEIPCIVQKRKVTVKDFFNKFEKNFNGKLHLFVQCKYLSLKTDRFHKDYFPENYRKFTEFAMCTWNYNTKICICLLFHDVYLTIDFFGHWNLIMLTVSKTGFFANIAKVFS